MLSQLRGHTGSVVSKVLNAAITGVANSLEVKFYNLTSDKIALQNSKNY